jgi:hypothetical protein
MQGAKGHKREEEHREKGKEHRFFPEVQEVNSLDFRRKTLCFSCWGGMVSSPIKILQSAKDNLHYSLPFMKSFYTFAADFGV